MRRIICPALGFTLVAAFGAASAIDISPSKTTVPRSSWDTGGNHFSIFNGDPKRIQRANAVDPASFDTKLEIFPNPMFIQKAKMAAPNPSVKITFSVRNHAKKTYTLSFPTAQRWDFRILNAAGTIIYTYSDDHEFVQAVGTSMVNQDDKLVYTESIDFDAMTAPLTPGTYKVQAVMANYPEMAAQAQLIVEN